MNTELAEYAAPKIKDWYSNKYTSIIGLVDKLRRHVTTHSWKLTRGLDIDKHTNELDRDTLYRIYMDDEEAILFGRKTMHKCKILELAMKGQLDDEEHSYLGLILSIIIDHFEEKANPFYWAQPDVLRRDDEFRETQELIDVKNYMIDNFEPGSLDELRSKLDSYVPQYEWEIKFETKRDYFLYIFADETPVVFIQNDKCEFKNQDIITKNIDEFNHIKRAFLDQTNKQTWCKISHTKRYGLTYKYI